MTNFAADGCLLLVAQCLQFVLQCCDVSVFMYKTTCKSLGLGVKCLLALMIGRHFAYLYRKFITSRMCNMQNLLRNSSYIFLTVPRCSSHVILAVALSTSAVTHSLLQWLGRLSQQSSQSSTEASQFSDSDE